MGKGFFKGALWGGALGAGLIWLNKTKTGKEVKQKLLGYTNDAYTEIMKRIPENEWVDKQKVDKVVQDVINEYGRTKEIAGTMKNLLLREVKRQLKQRKHTISK